MQLKCFLPSRNWENFPFVTILDQSQMETARHYMTILCLYCIAELHIHTQFSTIVAFPVTVPISSLFFHGFFLSSHLSPFLQCCHIAQDKEICTLFPLGPCSLPTSTLKLISELSVPAFLSHFHSHFPQLPQIQHPGQIPSEKQLWKAICTPCTTHPFPGPSANTPATHP